MANTTAKAATLLKSLHVPGNPLVVTNVWNLKSINALLSLNTNTARLEDNLVKAVATTSYAIAADIGTTDESLTLTQNLTACQPLAARAQQAGVPITLDLQDGYAENLEECITRAIEIGAAGANIEDCVPGMPYDKGLESCLYPFEEAVARIQRCVQVAKELGVQDFVVNARTDVFRLDPPLESEVAMEEALKRRKAFLEAGATTVFVWGGAKRGLRDGEVRRLTEGFGGRLAVKLGDGEEALTVRELRDIGVARVSCGGGLARVGEENLKRAAEAVLKGGKLE